MSPAVNFGDSGEFIAAAATLSIAHAPGYPLMSLLGHAVGVLLPFAGWAYKVNLASLLAASAALGIFFDALRRADMDGLPAAAGALWLGMSPLWLHTSLQAEVFALNSFFASCVFWVFCAYRKEPWAPRPLAAMGLALGLGGANHHTLILTVPAVLAGGLRAGRLPGELALRRFAWLLGFGLLGLAVYVYLPIRSGMGPPLDWGHPTNLDRFLHVLLRKDYGSFSLTVEGASQGRLASAFGQSARWLAGLWGGYGWAGCALAALGLWTAAREASAGSRESVRLPLFAAAWLFFAGPAFLWLGNPPFDSQTEGALQRFYLLSWFGVSYFVAEGVRRFREALPARAAAWAPALLAFPIAGACLTAGAWEMRWDLAAYDYGRNILRSLPPGATLFIDGGDDSFYTTAEQLYARGLRPDVEPHDRGGLVFPNPYGADFRRLGSAAKEERRQAVESVYAARRPTFYSTLREEILPGKRLGRWGLLRRADSARNLDRLWDLYVARHDEARAASYYRYRALTPVYGILRAAGEAEAGATETALIRLRSAYGGARDVRWVRDTASKAAEWAGYAASQAGEWVLAERAYLFALDLRPDQAEIWLNLGVTREKRELWDGAEAAYRGGLARSAAGGGNSFQAYYNLGTLFWKRKRFPEAAGMFSRAAEARPESAQARMFARRAAELAKQ